MYVKQLSVFLENRAGRLEDVLRALSDNHINIIALSLADTADYGMLRLIVSDAAKARKLLKSAGFSAMLTEVICVKVNHEAGSLNAVIRPILAEVGIEYMYSFSIGQQALNVIKFSDPAKAADLIARQNVAIWTAEEIEQL